MSIKKEGHPALAQVSDPVLPHEMVRGLVRYMREALAAEPGAGLAANQIGVTKRVILINTPAFVGVVVNPVITSTKGKKKISKEGCLSFPGLHVEVKRFNALTLEGRDEFGRPFKKRLRAFSAFVAQHEIDHLNGITLKDRTRGH